MAAVPVVASTPVACKNSMFSSGCSSTSSDPESSTRSRERRRVNLVCKELSVHLSSLLATLGADVQRIESKVDSALAKLALFHPIVPVPIAPPFGFARSVAEYSKEINVAAPASAALHTDDSVGAAIPEVYEVVCDVASRCTDELSTPGLEEPDAHGCISGLPHCEGLLEQQLQSLTELHVPTDDLEQHLDDIAVSAGGFGPATDDRADQLERACAEFGISSNS